MTCPLYVNGSPIPPDVTDAIPLHVFARLGFKPRKRLSLDHLAPRPPALDPALLPEPLRTSLVDEAERLGVPLAAVAGAALVAAGAIIGTTAKVQVKKEDPGWNEPGTQWGLQVGVSGARKTPAMRAALEPLHTIEATRREEFLTDAHAHKARRDVLERAIAKVTKQEADAVVSATPPATGSSSSSKRSVADLTEELAGIPREPKRIVTNDATVERLGTLAEANPRGILLVRDEMAGLLDTMHRDGHQNDRAFLLEAWSANASYTFDRIGRGSTTAHPLAIGVYGLIQPSVLRNHIKNLDHHAGGDGFFARFQIITLVDAHDVRAGQDRPRDEIARERTLATFRALDAAALDSIEDQPRGHYRSVRFSEDAQEHFTRWRERMEQRALDLGETALGAYCHKTPASGARLALIVHLIEQAAGNPAPEITLDQATRATALADHFYLHAEILYARDANPHARLARAIAAKVKDGAVADGMTVTDVGNLFDARARGSMEDIRTALDLLADLNWLRIEEHPRPKARSTFVVRLRGGSPPSTPPDGQPIGA